MVDKNKTLSCVQSCTSVGVTQADIDFDIDSSWHKDIEFLKFIPNSQLLANNLTVVLIIKYNVPRAEWLSNEKWAKTITTAVSIHFIMQNSITKVPEEPFVRCCYQPQSQAAGALKLAAHTFLRLSRNALPSYLAAEMDGLSTA